MPTLAVTVVGADRPGIIAEATAHLAGLGLNLEDSSMTRLRGHFAMTLVCAGEAARGDVEQALAPLTAGGALDVVVLDVDDAAERAASPAATPWVLSVHGGDRPGIVSAIAGEVARAGGNITDLTTRLSGDLYVLVAEIDLPADLGADAAAHLEAEVHRVARELGVGASLRPVDPDEL